MTIDAQLLEILVCPACHGAVDLHGSSDDAGAATGLACADCGRIYPIRDGIPVMLVDEASAPTRPAPGDG